MPKGKKSTKAKEKISYFEVITTYKISLKEKELQEAQNEVNRLTEVNDMLKRKTTTLNEKKDYNMNKALEDYKAFTNELNSRKKCDKDEVVGEMKKLWEFKQSEEREMLNVRKEIRKTEKEISAARKELKRWEDFKNVGTHDLSNQIRLLKKELDDMTENYNIISKSLRNSLDEYVNDIKKTTRETIEKKNKNVADKTFKEIDKSAIEMSRENEWTKEKIELYKKEIEDLKQLISDIENENVNLISYLFECNNDELKSIRNIFETQNQFLDDENLEETNIMNYDLNELESTRPKSELDQSIMREIQMRNKLNKEKSRMALAIRNKSVEKIDPLENKTLSLNGVKKSLIKRSLLTDDDDFTDDWPITQEMLNKVLNMATSDQEESFS